MQIDNFSEKQAKKYYREEMKKLDKTDEYINSQISFIFSSEGGYIERFEKLKVFLTNKLFYSSILISGSSVGTELFIAREFGFENICGTEISKLHHKISGIRLKEFKNIKSILVKDEILPLESNSFPVVMSGHIIEHTHNPEKYLCELFRVLKRNGLLYLEYPDRYNNIELHTNTKSYESLPLIIRYFVLSLLSSQLNRDLEKRKKYKSVRDTLVPVSYIDIEKWLKKNSINYQLLYSETPYKGVERKVLEKL